MQTDLSLQLARYFDNNNIISNRVYVCGHKYVLGPTKTHFSASCQASSLPCKRLLECHKERCVTPRKTVE